MDGSVILPDLGIVNVYGETLESAETKVKKIVELSYAGSDVILSLESLAAKKINIAISKKKRIVAVGTTVVRLLEACYSKYKTIKNFNEDIDLFIYPGYKFKVIDKLITNFHLPKSSLLILVSSFSTKNKIKEYYDFAIKSNMKFFSFGDAMLLDKYEF